MRSLLIGMLAVPIACSPTPEDRTSIPTKETETREEVFDFTGLRPMVTASNAVVIGSVRTVRQGRTLGEGSGGAIEMLDLVVDVEETLEGKSSDVVVVESDPVQVWAREWRNEGRRVLLFLDQSDDDPEGRFHPINSQAVYLLEGDDVLATSVDPLAEQISRMALTDLRSALRAAA